MPGFIKTPEDEKRWEKAKKIVEKQKGTAEGNWALVTHIYQNMKNASRLNPTDRHFLYALEVLAREAYEAADREMYNYAMFVRTWLLRGYVLTEEQEDRLQTGFHKYYISPLVGGKMSKNAAERLAEVYLTSGKIIPFPGGRATGPTVKIRGNQYVLSSDSGPLAGDLEEAHLDEQPQEGAKLVRGPSRGNYRFLWVYNVDRQEITMWRASDGNEKVHSPARSMTQDILRLDKKRQLNRVGTREYEEIRKYMDDLESNQLKQLTRTIRMTEGEFQKAVNKGVLEFFNKRFRPQVENALKQIDTGVIPFDFKVRESLLDYVSKEDQLKEHAIRTALENFGVASAETYLRSKGLDLESPMVDNQATEWAVNELIPHIYDEYLEGAPRFKFSS